MPAADSPRRHLIVVSIAFNRDFGSEPGKGYYWTAALSRYFHIHLVHAPEARFAAGDANLAEIESHQTAFGVESWSNWRTGKGYLVYHRWCEAAIASSRDLMNRFPIVGLHHVTMGGFRIIPRYDLLGLPYTLGPLGGGEFTPPSLLGESRFPLRTALVERMRPLINRACVLRPAVRAVLKGARRAIATTEETAGILRLGGARDVIVRFPDVFERPDDLARVSVRRASQCAEVAREVQMVWSGRGLWWKGGQHAITFIEHLRKRGIAARLSIYSSGPSIPALREQVTAAGLGEWVSFYSPVPRDELLAIYERMHLFVYPTMHDSSSSAIPEAYSRGLPSMTFGVGGVGVAADPAAGLNRSYSNLSEWISAGVAMVESWQRDPQRWLEASQAALRKSADFGFAQLVDRVGQDLAVF